MKARRVHTPELVAVCATEKPQALHLPPVLGILTSQILHVQIIFQPINKGPDKLPIVVQVNALRGRIDVIGVPGVQVVRRQDLADQY